MAAPSKGAQHYTFLLLPGLLSEIERLGLRHVISRSSLTERDITSLYFEVKTITQLLPDDPTAIDSAIWPDLLNGLRLLSLLVKETARDDLASAKKKAINQFLPQARKNIRKEFENRLQQGNVDFRLARIARTPPSPARAEETCIEAIRLERQRRYETMTELTTTGLNPHQAAVVEGAKTYVRDHMTQPPDDFGSLDLLISLGDLLRLLLLLDPEDQAPEAAPPGHITIDNVVMGIGNILYGDELGLNRSTLRQIAPAQGERH